MTSDPWYAVGPQPNYQKLTRPVYRLDTFGRGFYEITFFLSAPYSDQPRGGYVVHTQHAVKLFLTKEQTASLYGLLSTQHGSKEALIHTSYLNELYYSALNLHLETLENLDNFVQFQRSRGAAQEAERLKNAFADLF